MGSKGEPQPEAPDFTVTTLTPTKTPFPHDYAFIPSTTTQCHASNLLILKNGDLLCAFFGGSQEGRGDISIHLARKPSNSQAWTPAAQITHDSTRSEQNPVLFQRPDTLDLWLLYTSQNAGDQDSALVKRRVSHDDGHTWSEATTLFADEPGTFIRQPILVLENGTWILPTFQCRTEAGKRWVGNDDISVIRYTHDQGRTWSKREVPESYGCVHMAVKRLKDGSYLGLFRSRWADWIYASRSGDGIEWSVPVPTSLPNPNAGICFDVLEDGKVVVVYNHSSKVDAKARREGLYDEIAEEGDERVNQGSKHCGKEAFWGAPRAPLCVAWSDDGGRSFLGRRVLEDGDGFCLTNNSEQKLNRELSYPSVILGKDGAVHVAFTFWRQKIKYVVLRPEVFAS